MSGSHQVVTMIRRDKPVGIVEDAELLGRLDERCVRIVDGEQALAPPPREVVDQDGIVGSERWLLRHEFV